MRGARKAGLWILLAFFSIGCGGSEVGNPGRTPTGSVDPEDVHAVTSLEVMGVGVGVNATGSKPISLDSAWIAISDVAMIPFGHCSHPDPDEFESTFHGATVIDLLSNLATGRFKSAFLARGKYCWTVVVFTQLDPTRDDIASIRFSGHQAPTGPFEGVLINPLPMLMASRERGFEIPKKAEFKMFLGFDVQKWLEDVNLADVPVQGGVRRIDAINAPEIALKVLENVYASAHLFGDQNENGRLDDDEHDDSDDLLATGVDERHRVNPHRHGPFSIPTPLAE